MYQDIWVKGKLKQKGERNCSLRYEHIKKYLKKLEKPFSVLDIGANYGYFSFRIAEDFGAKVTMIESNKGVLNIIAQNDNSNVQLINKLVSVDDLKQLAKNKHYDVVLGLSILHHFEDYRGAIDAIFELGDLIFIEPPAPEEERGGYNGHRAKGINEYLNTKKSKVLTYTPNLRNLGKRPLLLFESK
ncbi:class I SAM-dependent methyltransferase [Paenibacillus sp. N4]|uniref:class I SAM-dependent methyltransferase n=1 Tax=Paenibacillus vietnamensis TaxID=2590547 RepID=UPI001CD0F5EB|nr:methyltransferase domain-containing protein [Paenibacillus vietnamensis]MCA0754945.1 class I SAM-dependent methyltransferase [Paenibacillus vietnamensis]